VCVACALVTLLTALALGVAWGSGVTPTNTWVDIYSSHSAFAGAPIPVGAYVAVFDPQATQCGQFTVERAGWYGIMPCYGDDPTTDGDEGPQPGERLYFAVNGVAATPQPVTRNGTPVPAGTPVTWTQNHDLWQVDLILPPRPPVTITLAMTTQLRLDWQHVASEITTYEVWRSTAPYFTPGDAGSERIGLLTPGGPGPLSWPDAGGLGDPAINYTYRVRSLDAMSRTVGLSQAVGEFEFAIYR
jgi:hypothetical protein